MVSRHCAGQELQQELAMGKEAKRQQYIHNYARTLQGRLTKELKRYTLHYHSFTSAIHIADDLYHQPVRDVILFHVAKESDEVLGGLACAGVGTTSQSHFAQPGLVTLHQVTNSTMFSGWPKWLDVKHPGRDIVLHLAACAVCAAMADNLWVDFQKAKQESATKLSS